ncbi:thiamine phosphate synthase [Prolixibacter sp. NT017]|uniref:thiamine phosphate synthase n=1 Tax=Prolixibacter sp. NT017 TaxID=2652390 RepID=UPI00127B4C12|nr:thiamine phosphate synthase [Prolixibacter sp. NT017]GET25561.1 thiamine-phosphate synthase [Prolixibacter sp. NT017]
MTSFDLSLYLVTDRELSNGRSLSYIVEEAVKGGVTMVQLREKDGTTREFYELGIRMKALLDPLHIPLVINDRLDIALAVDADGLHIGQSDMPWQVARGILGKNKILGLSVETMQQVEKANRMDVDYIGISPVFATLTKTDTLQPFGLEGLKEATSLSRHPAVAIGGINLQNAAQVMDSRADGIAVVSAISSADNPQQAARELKLAIKKRVPNEME